ncbi:MAG: hypothetical protein KY445_17435 [Armatimonadetes bacterium]|nr:hypothetical protein [Armatimonadota bacterium]
MNQPHNPQTLNDFLSEQAAPQAKIVQAYKAIDGAVFKAKPMAQSVRYGYFLRQTPEFVLDGIAHAGDGDIPASLVLAYMTTRVGSLLHKARNPVLMAAQGKEGIEAEGAENAVIARIAPRLYVDCVREKIRRGKLIEFDPSSDPFASREAKVLRITPEGAAQDDVVKAVLDKYLGYSLLDEVEESHPVDIVT